MRALVSWLQTWWLRVPAPREISVAFTIAYSLAFATGAATLLYPPITLSAEAAGPQAIASVGALLVVGAVLGMLGGAWEHWKLERVGLWLMSGALVIYAAIIVGLHLSTQGSRLTQLGVISLALCLFLVRYLMIRRFTFRPRG